MYCYDFGGDNLFEYNPEWEDIKDALEDIIRRAYKLTANEANAVVKVLDDLDLLDNACEFFEDDLKDCFEDDAREEWENSKEYKESNEYYHRQGIM